MQCPVCKTKRCSPVELEEGLRASACETCGGRWISHEDYSAWLKHHGATLPEKPFSEVEFDVGDVQEAKLCPDCQRILLKYKVGHGLDFFVDHCPGCGGVWLDRNEWQALQGKNLHDEIHRIFSTSWQRQVRGEQMAAKLDQAYARRFGQESYAKVKEVRQWIQEHPQKRALLAFLSDDNPYKI
ncbi:MAG: zf-TFIIB domain-containing protein [Kiritimatiellae bacterium]|nr:zf-TFIIB domain-containing protein [Kiritimatiellia bacterium]